MSFGNICFNNLLIVQKIFEHLEVERCSISTVEYRGINKCTNYICLAKIRRSHNEIVIHCCQFTELGKKNKRKTVNVNLYEVRIPQTASLFRFLNKTAGVRIASIEGRNLWMIPVEENWRKELHDSIINELMLNQSPRKFVGFQDYCGGVCQQCSRYPVQSKEYGPLDLRAMKTFTAHHHFDKLYISELFFEHAGLFCALLQQNNIQGCEVALLNRITQNITCSTLHFEFFETYWRQEHTSPAPLRPIPRQILMRMCTAWRPKVIELQFRLCWRAYYHHTWPQNASFEKVYFEEDFQDVPKTSSNSPIYFDLVKIDLRFSINACQDILDNENSKFQYARYRNLIANVRRMFPTNKIAIEFAEKVTGLNYGLLRSLFKTVWKNENERDLTLDCNVYLEIGSENLCDFDLLQSKIYFENRYLECSLSPTSISLTLPCQQTLLTYFRKKPDSHWIGRTLQITEKASNCIINLNLYVDKKCMKNLMRDAPEQVERGYLKHFKF